MLPSKGSIKILITAAVIISTSYFQADALTSSEHTSGEYIHNHGHSKETARIVELQKDQIAGKEQSEKNKFFVKWYRKITSYLDPFYDDDKFGSQEIKF